MKKGKKGFTLIEMLVVIAIVAILVAIIVPTVTASMAKANATTDAANLRSVLGEANVVVFGEDHTPAQTVEYTSRENVKCKSFKNAKLYLVYTVPGFIDVFFVDGDVSYDPETGVINGGSYYGLDYFCAVAEGRDTTGISLAQPTYAEGYDPFWHCLSDN